MPAGPKVVFVGDVGGPAFYHAGDEAMLSANLDWLRTELPGLRPVLLSDDPEFSAAWHRAKALQEPRLPGRLRSPEAIDLEVRGHRLKLALASLFAFSGRERVRRYGLVEALRTADLLFISGGGNLTSLFPREIQLRSFCALAALGNGVPVVVTGQTLGPELREEEKRLLAAWLPRTSYLGLRDGGTSPRLARELGVPEEKIAVTLDDAFDLKESAPRPELAGFVEPARGRPLIGLSIHPWGTSELAAQASRWSSLLDEVASATGARLLLLPHVWHRERDSDTSFGRAVRDRMERGDRLEIPEGLLMDRELKFLTARCDFLITTRYHGLIFALSSEVPCAGIHQDAYTRAKLEGAFRSVGSRRTSLSVDDPRLSQRMLELWSEREEFQAQLAEGSRDALRALRGHRERLAGVLRSLLAASRPKAA